MLRAGRPSTMLRMVPLPVPGRFSLYLPGTGRGTAGPRPVVEGCPLATGVNDQSHDCLNVAQHFGRRHAQGSEAEPAYDCIPLLIPRRPVTPRMRLAIDLDRQARLQAREVETVRPKRMLSPELVPPRTLAESAPEQHLRQVAGAAFAAGAQDGGAGCREDPSTMLRMVPLPVPGRYERHAHHIRNTPKRAPSGATGAFSVTRSTRPSTSRVWAGSMMPSSHSRAVA